MNELDEILLEQLHNAMRNKQKLRRIERLTGKDPVIDKGRSYIEGRIKFYESMIQDKSLLKKKPKRKKMKESDLLARNPVYEWYRNTFIITTLGYKMLWNYLGQYYSYFRKGKE